MRRRAGETCARGAAGAGAGAGAFSSAMLPDARERAVWLALPRALVGVGIAV